LPFNGNPTGEGEYCDVDPRTGDVSNTDYPCVHLCLGRPLALRVAFDTKAVTPIVNISGGSTNLMTNSAFAAQDGIEYVTYAINTGSYHLYGVDVKSGEIVVDAPRPKNLFGIAYDDSTGN
jgi:hypothetical protein